MRCEAGDYDHGVTSTNNVRGRPGNMDPVPVVCISCNLSVLFVHKNQAIHSPLSHQCGLHLWLVPEDESGRYNLWLPQHVGAFPPTGNSSRRTHLFVSHCAPVSISWEIHHSPLIHHKNSVHSLHSMRLLSVIVKPSLPPTHHGFSCLFSTWHL